ncbi:MAG: nicotinate-nucleotide adenylyltransferase [Muribaculaceae bacterium]|nr:nicotinate-nucleotide adenylyltransferase [Muribaculaceae bacterium]
MNIGIFGGSFDPIHEGHANLAKYVLDHTDLDEVWLMVSPLNPLKPQGYVATNEQRLEMARLAVEGIPGIRVSDFEFHLPIPSYTYKTLTELKKSYPDHDFRLIIGGDNWADFDKWKNPDEILKEFSIIIYPRPNESIIPSTQNPTYNTQNVTILDNAPKMPISSTQIRHLLASQQPDLKHASSSLPLNQKVSTYIHIHSLYQSPL